MYAAESRRNSMNSTTMFGFGEDCVATAPTPMAYRFARATTRARHAGFTLIELLVVIAILALIISLVLVGVGRAMQSSRATMCRGNLRSIGIAVNTYSESNKGHFPSPRTSTPPGWASLKLDLNDPASSVREDASNSYIGWVRTETTSSPAFNSIGGSGSDQYETLLALESGSLYTYIGDSSAYKSPQDPTDRLRSYSLSSFIGVLYCDDENDSDGLAKNYSFDTRTVARIQKPAETLLALPEQDPTKGPRGWNVNGFRGNPAVTVVTNGAAPATYSNAKWYDAPAVWNPGSINMAHVDGSVDSYEIQSLDMKEGELQKNWTSGSGYVDPDGDTYVDLNNIKKMLLPGKIK